MDEEPLRFFLMVELKKFALPAVRSPDWYKHP
jgi:hypothetical protein